MKKILVTGATGQLGRCFQQEALNFSQLEFVFADSESFDLTLPAVVGTFLRENQFDYCINCAAYTNVEQAETHREMAFHVNADGVKTLARECKENDTVLIHFSTDYVFDGSKDSPYSEEDETCPINVYGRSKLMGEEHIEQEMDAYFIFRTSWLYSEYGHNFYNTIRKKAKAGEQLNITTEQKGTPTNAHDLARFVLTIISEENKEFGTYNYSNMGEATWFDFAAEILKLTGYFETVELVESNSFPTLASRPVNSVLSKKKALQTFEQDIPAWEESLRRMVES